MERKRMKPKVWIYDNDLRLKERYTKQLRGLPVASKHFDIESMDTSTFESQMEALVRRQRDLRSSRNARFGKELILDEASIFIIDYDLLAMYEGKNAQTGSSKPKIGIAGSFLTGELVSYLTRVFSKCKILIGLNQFGGNTFDLTLKGHPESFADLNIGSEQLCNAGLWGATTTGFRPWYWPSLPRYLKAFEEKVADVRANLDKPIAEVLGFSDVASILPRSATEFVRESPSKTSFRQFAKMALWHRDNRLYPETIASVAAARISKWLERLVLPGQYVLVDAPHLVSRFPSLLKGDHTSSKTWNISAGFDEFDHLNLKHGTIEKFRFRKSYWIPRPVWFWGGLSEFRKIAEVKDPWKKRERADLCFCEDDSQFHKRKNCREFLSEVDSPYAQRFVYGRYKGVEYRPLVRLLE
jgi:hypothetical protein